MAVIKRPLQSLNKKEFKEAYEDMAAKYADKLDKRPLPTIQEVAKDALSKGYITIEKYMEFTTD